MGKTYDKDHRESNPGLHLLYVKWAVLHLKEIDNCMEKLLKFSNINLHDVVQAMHLEREKLITENAAYADANEILLSLQGKSLPLEEAERA